MIVFDDLFIATPNAGSMFTEPGRGSAPDIGNFDEVVRFHWSRIFHFVLVSVRDRNLAEDLTQDCFWKAYRGWKGFRGESSVSTWLRHIAVNVIKNFARNKRVQFWRRVPSIDPASIGEWRPDFDRCPEADVLLRERLGAIWEAVELVSQKQRMAFLLRFVEEMDLFEIAQVMGISEGAVKVHLFRAVRSVRKTLKVSIIESTGQKN